MRSPGPKFEKLEIFRSRPAARFAGRFLLFCSLFLLLRLALAGGARATPGAASGDIAFTSATPSPSVAIADFDGDSRPDLASVQTGAGFSGGARYWIQLQLSAAGRQSIQLAAPAGGLLIEARDVNGDHALDLVLSTAWLQQPVAIFLNDGHGNFSRAALSAFPAAFHQSKTNWRSNFAQEASVVATPPQSREGVCPEARGWCHGRFAVSLIPAGNSGFLCSPLLLSHAGRAPPSQAFLI